MTAMGDLDLSRAAWRKSTYSNNGGSCIEIAAARRNSAQGRPVMVAVRDSKNPDGPKLAFTSAQWKAFTSTVKA